MIMWQLMKGVQYLHSCEVLHRDLKPKHLLFDTRTGTLKVASLDMSRASMAQDGRFTHEARSDHRTGSRTLLCQRPCRM